MGGFFSLDSKFMQAMSRVADLIILNVIYLVTCLPVVTIGAAGTALYTVCFRLGTDREGSLVKGYFRAFRDDDLEKAYRVEPLEQVIDDLKEKMRIHHILRMQQGSCSIESGFVWSDLLTALERVGDHCSNIAARLVGMEAGEDYDSHTLKNMMHHNPTKEYMLNYEQCRKDYLIPLEQLEA